MIHFSIAYRLYNNYPSASFVLGSVAPDAVLVRHNDKSGKLKSHLVRGSGQHPEIQDLIDFVKTNLTDHNNDRRDFLFGYASHIYADLKWVELKNEVSNHDGSLRRLLWQEENQLDYLLYRSIAWTDRLKADIMRSPLFEVEGLYRIDELDKWRNRIFEWLDDPSNEPGIVNTYIEESMADRFIGNIAREISELETMLI
ncbi:zinc dependent phospholipase C family protein [Paenibacillus tarimensis]